MQEDRQYYDREFKIEGWITWARYETLISSAINKILYSLYFNGGMNLIVILFCMKKHIEVIYEKER